MVTVSPEAPPPGKPHANLESYTFPTETPVNAENAWSMVIHNNGDAIGTLGAGIGNMSGNPGNIVITYVGVERTIEPGKILYLYTTRDVCERLSPKGTVRFLAEGHYTVRLAGAHKDPVEGWIIDTFEDVG